MMSKGFEIDNFLTIGISKILKKRKFKKFKTPRFFSLIFIFGVISLGVQLQPNKIQNQLKMIDLFLANNGFSLKNVEITGMKHTNEKEFFEIFNNYKNSSIFSVDLSKIHREILKNNWVSQNYVERVLPDTIKIKIVENVPIAIWQNNIGNNIVTKDGKLLLNVDINKFKNKLPIINGNKANQNISSLLDILKSNEFLAREIWSLSFINMRRWDLHFKQGLVIRLPSENVNQAWKIASSLYEKYNILHLGLIEIDLRNTNQILGKINFDKEFYKNRKSL